MKIYQFIPSKTLNEFNSKLDETGNKLDFGDDDRDENMLKRVVVPNNDPDLDIFKSASPSKVKNDVHDQQQRRASAHSEAGQQLALLKYFNQLPQVITTSRPVGSHLVDAIRFARDSRGERGKYHLFHADQASRHCT
ncbi:PREDICTED: uncharacterized protein LOC105448323 [Wasmannia auropunctata]|uniref:uncharacterized protein LOC105448323 n=1 Tax=Wasmannia auropunctata TaxID=64793 RepID=UPI0005F03D7F|nr:PREDICTED: uncharacterized protein LOC105448323 [Wasmannia auropunctata]